MRRGTSYRPSFFRSLGKTAARGSKVAMSIKAMFIRTVSNPLASNGISSLWLTGAAPNSRAYCARMGQEGIKCLSARHIQQLVGNLCSFLCIVVASRVLQHPGTSVGCEDTCTAADEPSGSESAARRKFESLRVGLDWDKSLQSRYLKHIPVVVTIAAHAVIPVNRVSIPDCSSFLAEIWVGHFLLRIFQWR